jgi:hypothetical protein
MAERYGSLSLQEIDDLKDFVDSKNTKIIIMKHVAHFRKYLKEKKMDENFESHEKENLCSELKLFLANARNKEGELYKLNTFNQMCFALKKHLMKEGIDWEAEEFVTLRECVKAVRKRISKSGKGTTDHKPSIEKHDLAKLYEPGMCSQHYIIMV